ncbi:hypothetical protein ACHAXS_006153 [Conticribra weissflogii]
MIPKVGSIGKGMMKLARRKSFKGSVHDSDSNTNFDGSHHPLAKKTMMSDDDYFGDSQHENTCLEHPPLEVKMTLRRSNTSSGRGSAANHHGGPFNNIGTIGTSGSVEDDLSLGSSSQSGTTSFQFDYDNVDPWDVCPQAPPVGGQGPPHIGHYLDCPEYPEHPGRENVHAIGSGNDRSSNHRDGGHLSVILPPPPPPPPDSRSSAVPPPPPPPSAPAVEKTSPSSVAAVSTEFKVKELADKIKKIAVRNNLSDKKDTEKEKEKEKGGIPINSTIYVSVDDTNNDGGSNICNINSSGNTTKFHRRPRCSSMEQVHFKTSVRSIISNDESEITIPRSNLKADAGSSVSNTNVHISLRRRRSSDTGSGSSSSRRSGRPRNELNSSNSNLNSESNHSSSGRRNPNRSKSPYISRSNPPPPPKRSFSNTPGNGNGNGHGHGHGHGHGVGGDPLNASFTKGKVPPPPPPPPKRQAQAPSQQSRTKPQKSKSFHDRPDFNASMPSLSSSGNAYIIRKNRNGEHNKNDSTTFEDRRGINRSRVNSDDFTSHGLGSSMSSIYDRERDTNVRGAGSGNDRSDPRGNHAHEGSKAQQRLQVGRIRRNTAADPSLSASMPNVHASFQFHPAQGAMNFSLNNNDVGKNNSGSAKSKSISFHDDGDIAKLRHRASFCGSGKNNRPTKASSFYLEPERSTMLPNVKEHERSEFHPAQGRSTSFRENDRASSSSFHPAQRRKNSFLEDKKESSTSSPQSNSERVSMPFHPAQGAIPCDVARQTISENRELVRSDAPDRGNIGNNNTCINDDTMANNEVNSRGRCRSFPAGFGNSLDKERMISDDNRLVPRSSSDRYGSPLRRRSNSPMPPNSRGSKKASARTPSSSDNAMYSNSKSSTTMNSSEPDITDTDISSSSSDDAKAKNSSSTSNANNNNNSGEENQKSSIFGKLTSQFRGKEGQKGDNGISLRGTRFDKTSGRCVHHPSIIVARKKPFAKGWDMIRDGCPLCMDKKDQDQQESSRPKGSKGIDELLAPSRQMTYKWSKPAETNNSERIPGVDEFMASANNLNNANNLIRSFSEANQGSSGDKNVNNANDLFQAAGALFEYDSYGVPGNDTAQYKVQPHMTKTPQRPRRSSNESQTYNPQAYSQPGTNKTDPNGYSIVSKMPYTTPWGESGWYSGLVNEAGIPNGKGRMRFKDGSQHDGVWANGYSNVYLESNHPVKKSPSRNIGSGGGGGTPMHHNLHPNQGYPVTGMYPAPMSAPMPYHGHHYNYNYPATQFYP